MSNELGLILIGLGLLSIIAFVIVVDRLAKRKPDTKWGKLAQRINAIIERLPED
jgi:hypothetical protein